MADTVSVDSVAQDQLRAFIERIERMEEEKKAISEDIKEIYAEAKGNGFDTKVMRKIVAIRKMDHAERMEQEALLDLYMGALGMQPSLPLNDDFDPPPRGSRTEHRADMTGLRQIGSVATGIVTSIQFSNSATASSSSQAMVERATGTPSDGLHDAGEAAVAPQVEASPAEIRLSTADADISMPVLREANEAPERVVICPADPLRSEAAVGNEAEASAPGAPVSPAGEVAAAKSGEASVASPAPPKLKMNPEFFQEPHPMCQRPGFCGGNSNLALCEKCAADAYPVHAEAAE